MINNHNPNNKGEPDFCGDCEKAVFGEFMTFCPHCGHAFDTTRSKWHNPGDKSLP